MDDDRLLARFRADAMRRVGARDLAALAASPAALRLEPDLLAVLRLRLGLDRSPARPPPGGDGRRAGGGRDRRARGAGVRVLVAGGGMAGLVLARGVQGRGGDVAIIERAPAGRRIPGPIMLPFQSYDALDEIGVLD